MVTYFFLLSYFFSLTWLLHEAAHNVQNFQLVLATLWKKEKFGRIHNVQSNDHHILRYVLILILKLKYWRNQFLCELKKIMYLIVYCYRISGMYMCIIWTNDLIALSVDFNKNIYLISIFFSWDRGEVYGQRFRLVSLHMWQFEII